jgi:hypothetical protein
VEPSEKDDRGSCWNPEFSDEDMKWIIASRLGVREERSSGELIRVPEGLFARPVGFEDEVTPAIKLEGSVSLKNIPRPGLI